MTNYFTVRLEFSFFFFNTQKLRTIFFFVCVFFNRSVVRYSFGASGNYIIVKFHLWIWFFNFWREMRKEMQVECRLINSGVGGCQNMYVKREIKGCIYCFPISRGGEQKLWDCHFRNIYTPTNSRMLHLLHDIHTYSNIRKNKFYHTRK